MSPRVSLNDVSVTFSLLTVEDYNLKRQIIRGFGRRRPGAVSPLLALSNISLELEEGDRLQVTGSNGAGKTTLLRVIAGALSPTSGTLITEGRVMPLLGGPGATLDGTLTGRENIVQVGMLLGESPRHMQSLIDEIAEFSGLKDRLKTPVSTYSSGMAARLRFSIVTALRPDILVMDEGIASTADPEFSTRAKVRLEQFRKQVSIVIWSSFTHSLHGLATKNLLLEDGTGFVCPGDSNDS
jgi:ABC-2 type transport system ATP-binding protein/lipopolysaccharide transport system ATP-binding protein